MAHSSGQNERIERELDVSIFGIGVSVVNNSPYCNSEIIYTSISSSDIVWEIRKPGKSRYKSLTSSQCELIERDFQGRRWIISFTTLLKVLGSVKYIRSL